MSLPAKIILSVVIALNVPLMMTAAIAAEIHTAGGAKLIIEWRGEFSNEERQKLKSWMDSVMETVRLLHGEPPRPEIRIAFKPYSSRSPVPFARVLRNDPEGVLFYVNPAYPLEDFVSDWTAYHELGHLFIPYPGIADVWFSEGLASYYQNILQLRAGLMTPEETRNRFQAAFERGRKDDKHTDLTLGELSPVMRERLAFMRVYWSGALYFMEADIQLRRLDNPITLDDVLREYGQCCLTAPGRQDGLRIAREFDSITGEPVFVPLYESYELSSAIPDYEPVLAAPEMDNILTPRSETR